MTSRAFRDSFRASSPGRASSAWTSEGGMRLGAAWPTRTWTRQTTTSAARAPEARRATAGRRGGTSGRGETRGQLTEAWYGASSAAAMPRVSKCWKRLRNASPSTSRGWAAVTPSA